MNTLKDWLLGLKHKTVFITGLLIVVSVLQGESFTPQTASLVTLCCGILLILFKAFAPTGELEKGWSFWFYASNGFICALQISDMFLGSGLLGEQGVVVMQKVQLYINAVFSAIQLSRNNGGSSGSAATV